MKKIIECVSAFALCLLIFGGCVRVTEPSQQGIELPLQNNNLLRAWVGEWTEDKRSDAISEYGQDYETVVMNGMDGTYVTFEMDFKVVEAQVVCMSKVNDQEEQFELNEYTDVYIKTECRDNKIIVHTEWWYLGGDGTNHYPEWSYLVRVEDPEGAEHYCYFRVSYSK